MKKKIENIAQKRYKIILIPFFNAQVGVIKYIFQYINRVLDEEKIIHLTNSNSYSPLIIQQSILLKKNIK